MIRDSDVAISCLIRGAHREIFMPSWDMAWSFLNFARFMKAGNKWIRLLDVGACCGAFALPVVNATPASRVICVEPSSWSWPYLEANVKGIEGLTIIKSAASDKEEMLTLSMPPTDKAARIGVESVYGTGGFAQTVPAYPLDDIVNEPIDLIKIDVEGHEIPVINGARRLIAEYHPDLLVEIKEVRQGPAGHVGHHVIRDIIRLGYGFPRGATHHDFLFEWGQ